MPKTDGVTDLARARADERGGEKSAGRREGWGENEKRAEGPKGDIGKK